MTFASAASRIAQVLMTTTSACSIAGASAHPAARSRPAISSESLLFIWHPSVQTKNAGSARGSGRNSPSRSSSGWNGPRAPAGAVTGGAMSRTGRLRVVIRPRSYRAGCSDAQRGAEARHERGRHPEPRVRARVRPEVAVVVRPAGLDEPEGTSRLADGRPRVLVERAMVALEAVEPLPHEIAQERDPHWRLAEVGDRREPARGADGTDRLDRRETGPRHVARLPVAEDPPEGVLDALGEPRPHQRACERRTA